MNIDEEKAARTAELRLALDAEGVGIDASGKVSQEMIEAAKVILGTRAKLQDLLLTPAINEFVRNIERSLDSLMVAEMDQVDPKKRKRAVGEILNRLNRSLIQVGFEDQHLVDAVHVEIPVEKES